MQLGNSITDAVAVARDGLQLHVGGVPVLLSAPAAPLAARVRCGCGTQRVFPSLVCPQAEAHVSKHNSEDHTKPTEDGDEGQIHGFHVLGGQQEEWLRPVGWGMLSTWYCGNKVPRSLCGWRKRQIQANCYIVRCYGNFNVVLNCVAGVEAALVLPGLDDQQAIRPCPEAGVEVVALHLATVQGPKWSRQVRVELALQQHVIADPNRTAPLGHIWKINILLHSAL